MKLKLRQQTRSESLIRHKYIFRALRQLKGKLRRASAIKESWDFGEICKRENPRLWFERNENAKSSTSKHEYPSIQSKQSFRDARRPILIRNEIPPIGLHYLSYIALSLRTFPSGFSHPMTNNRSWKRLLGFLTPVTATLRLLHGSIGSPILEFMNIKWFRDLPQVSRVPVA